MMDAIGSMQRGGAGAGPELITNGDLLRRARAGVPSDEVFMVCSPPLVDSKDHRLTAVIKETTPAAVLHRAPGMNPTQPLVSEIAHGDGTRWLLSGGMLILDDQNRIAVGLRDGNAADPFAFTNIGAGRCDQEFKAHCLEEFRTEFVLVVRDDGRWEQVTSGAGGKMLGNLKQPDIARAVRGILEQGPPAERPLDKSLMARRSKDFGPMWTLRVEWRGAGSNRVESARGLIWKGPNTIEFRRPIRLRLSRFQENRIFFGEGTGYAEWWSFESLKRMALGEKITGRRLITPFLRSLTLKESLLLLLIPTGATAAAFNDYGERTKRECGANPANELPPHATLVRHFKAEPRQFDVLIRTLDEIVAEHTELLGTPSVYPGPVQFGNGGYHHAPIASEKVESIRSAFARRCLTLEGVGFMREKSSIRLNIAYGFDPEQEAGLQRVARECLGGLGADWWELRLVWEQGGSLEILGKIIEQEERQEVLRSWTI